MKKLLLAAIVGSVLVAGTSVYPSYHQHVNESGKKGLIYQVTNEEDYLIKTSGYYSDSFKYTLKGDAVCQESGGCKGKNLSKVSWCSNDWSRFKIYIPRGFKEIVVKASSSPDVSYILLMTFNPTEKIDYQNIKTFDDFFPGQTNNIDYASHLFNKYLFEGNHTVLKKVRNNGEVIRLSSDDIKELPSQGGWLYVQMTQASQVMGSHGGYHHNPSIAIEYTIYFDDDRQSFQDWLDSTYFVESGDPIDGFDVIPEVNRYCLASNNDNLVKGSTEGVLGSVLLNGGSANEPSLKQSIQPSQSKRGDIVDIELSIKNGEEAIQSITVDLNGNQTEGVLLEDRLPACFSFVGGAESDRGHVVYSSDGKEWYGLNDNLDNIRYLGLIIEDNNPTDGDSEIVLDAGETVNFKFKVQVNSSCDEWVKNSATLHYKNMNGEIRKKEKIGYLHVISETQNNTNSGNNYNYNNGGNNYNNNANTSSTSNGGSNSTSSGCDTYPCVTISRDSYSNSYSSYSYSSSNTSSDTTSESTGNHSTTNNQTCDVYPCTVQNHSSAQTSVQNSSASADENVTQLKIPENVAKVIKKIEKKTLPVKGYFTNYGNGAFDWIYVSGNRIWKLDGLKDNGEFKWTELTEYLENVSVEDNKKLFIGKSKVVIEHEDNGGETEETSSSATTSSSSSSSSSSSISSKQAFPEINHSS